MTRFMREHPSIDVELDPEGRLVAIRWAGQREPVEVCNRWRIEEAWWRGTTSRWWAGAGWRWSTSTG